MTNGPHTFYYVDVFRNGAIRSHINENSILRTYDELGIRNFNGAVLSELLALPMRRLVSGETFDYANPRTPEEWITTGLLLGYPLESTAWLLEKLHKGK